MSPYVSLLVLPILLLVFFALRFLGVLKREWSAPLTYIGFNLGFPALIFLTFLKAKIETTAYLNPILGFGFSFSLFLVGLCLSKILPIPESKKPILVASLATLEGGAVGYPFFAAIFGVDNLFQIVLIDLGVAFFTLTILTMYLFRSYSTKNRFLDQITGIFKVPVFWAMGLGLVLNLMGFKLSTGDFLGALVIKILESVGTIAIPLILMGLVLSFELKKIELVRALAFSFVSLGISVLVAYLWSFTWRVIPFSKIAMGAFAITALLPPSTYVYSWFGSKNHSEENKSSAGQLFSVTLLVSIIILLILGPYIAGLV